MGALIDASVLIQYERGRLDLATKLKPVAEEEFFLSVVTASELLHGVHRARESRIRERRSAFVEAIFELFPLLPVDYATARVHAQIWADLSARGHLIGPHDLWIAATCIAHGHRIMTANSREFGRVSGLVVEAMS
jgi:predicted nucleic acid-binding protein